MGWFDKKENKKEEVLSLPKLPELPEPPKIGGDNMNKDGPIYPLPSFPSNSFGEKSIPLVG